jgi:glycosyltransferase involved in cell wall biosynthesis
MPPAHVAILYPADPVDSVPSGIDSFIRGIIKWSPADLRHTLVGASADPQRRPLGREVPITLGDVETRYLPIVEVDRQAKRAPIPLIVRYMWALQRLRAAGRLTSFDILDFHRIEPLCLFMRDRRPRNLFMHQDMSVIRDPSSDILWRHAPWAYEAMESRLMVGLDSVFAVRRSAVERYQKLHPERRDRFRFIPTWVDTAVFRPAASEEARAKLRGERLAPGRQDVCSLLVFVGRFDRQKNPLLLLEAFESALQRRPRLHLAMVGDGVLRPQVEAHIRNRGLESKVSLLGVLAPPKICEVLQAGDLFVLSSAYEGMPIAVLEALACGLPVVSTRVGEVDTIVKDGVNGFISRDQTAGALGLAIGAALDAGVALRGAACTESVRPFHPRAVLDSIFDVHRRQALERAA